MKRAIITTLGMIGKDKNGEFAKVNYFFDDSIIKLDKSVQFVNVFPLFIELFSKNFQIIPLYTEESHTRQQETLKFHNIDFDIAKNGVKIDENSPNEIFDAVNQILLTEKYSNIIVDVTHGFRSIPILTTINMVIANFQNNQKIMSIIYAQEDFENKGNYLIKDLKEYLEISNISFILTTFNKNYTVANHIKSKKYGNLIESLENFSNDIMALSLNNLYKNTSRLLIKELETIDNISIKFQAENLKIHIENMCNYEGKKRFETFYNLAKDLFEKNYMLLSLSLLFESIRLYIKSTIKKEHPSIVEEVESKYNNDLYKIGDFFKNLKWKNYEKFINDKKNKIDISEKNYNKLKNSYPKYLKKLYEDIDKKRNNLAHANSDTISFHDIKSDIETLFNEYEKLCIKDKSSNDLKDFFNQR